MNLIVQHEITKGKGKKLRDYHKQQKSHLPRFPSQVEVATAWDSNIPSIWWAVHSVKSSCVITCPTNATRNCSASETRLNWVSWLLKKNNLLLSLSGMFSLRWLFWHTENSRQNCNDTKAKCRHVDSNEAKYGENILPPFLFKWHQNFSYPIYAKRY